MASPAQASFAAGVLRGVGAPVTPQNIAGIIGWAQAEGGWAHNNPLNTTQGASGATNFNSVGVKAYPNLQVGVQATVQTLQNGRYAGIINALKHNNPSALAPAIGASPWGTNGQLAAKTIRDALGQKIDIPSGTGAVAPTSAPSLSTPTTSFDQAGFQQAQRQYLVGNYLRQSSSSPYDISKSNVPNPNASLARLLPTAPPNRQDYTTLQQAATSQLQKLAGTPLVNVHRGASGDVNPIPGAVIGRTDMGVDVNLKPGAPIVAPNQAKVVAIAPNWYKGQPYVALQLMAGPNKGKVMYVAEQVAPNVKVGQTLGRGAVIGRYAPSGTGIEIGWADPQNPTRTLAQSTTGYSEGQVTKAGSNFRSYLGSF